MPESSASFGSTLSYAAGAVSLSEVISAMTFALDLTEGAVPGHGLRSCLLGMRLAETLNVPPAMRASLYYALQLKDVGCSNNAARVTQIVGGDDRAMKSATKRSDWRQPVETMRNLWPHVMPERNVVRRGLRFVAMGIARERNNREMTKLRCDRGADIVRQLELGDVAAEAVRRLDELWDGTGYPDKLKGARIPMLARICAVAQNLDVFAIEEGPDVAMEVLEKRSGTWFDPEIVRAARMLHEAGMLWRSCGAGDDLEETRREVLRLDPGLWAELVPERVDKICEAFARVVDAKSPFTYRHSIRVADVAVEMAKEMKLGPERVQMVRRAALLHDIGKLHVPNTILDKTSNLSMEEWTVVLEHPKLTRSILERVSSFRELAALAAEHHERVDGSGYPGGLKGEQMSVESRLLAVADCYTALAEERPYRGSIAPERILKMMAKDVPLKLDASCFEALVQVVARWHREPDGKGLASRNVGWVAHEWRGDDDAEVV
jgi:putative nucleotidyltransferase with HDIG domain